MFRLKKFIPMAPIRNSIAPRWTDELSMRSAIVSDWPLALASDMIRIPIR